VQDLKLAARSSSCFKEQPWNEMKELKTASKIKKQIKESRVVKFDDSASGVNI
jgi:hypothetical protein